METTLMVVKLLSLISAACFGIIGIVHDYKDKNTGRITLWGRTALAGVVASAAISASAQLVEYRMGVAGSLAAAAQMMQNVTRQQALLARSEKILARTTELQYPFEADRLEFFFELTHDANQPGFAAYAQNIRAAFDRFVDARPVEERKQPPGVLLDAFDPVAGVKWTYRVEPDGGWRLTAMEAEADSKLFPTDRFADLLLRKNQSYQLLVKRPNRDARLESLEPYVDTVLYFDVGSGERGTDEVFPAYAMPAYRYLLKADFLNGEPSFRQWIWSRTYRIYPQGAPIRSVFDFGNATLDLSRMQGIQVVGAKQPHLGFFQISVGRNSETSIRWQGDAVRETEQDGFYRYVASLGASAVSEQILGLKPLGVAGRR